MTDRIEHKSVFVPLVPQHLSISISVQLRPTCTVCVAQGQRVECVILSVKEGETALLKESVCRRLLPPPTYQTVIAFSMQ